MFLIHHSCYLKDLWLLLLPSLVENKQYSAFVYVQFNGGVTWKSQSSVNISEYCVLYIDCKTFKNVIQQLLMFGKSKWFQ